jgi:hypothetical protein
MHPPVGFDQQHKSVTKTEMRGKFGALLLLPAYEYNAQGVQRFQAHCSLAEEMFSIQPQQVSCHHLAILHHILSLLLETAVTAHGLVL